jgi:uncharacterized membrane protein YkoI
MIHVRELSGRIRYLIVMKIMLTRRMALLLGFALACAGGGLAYADDRDDDDDGDNGRDRDHERARRALEEGLARPLAEILERVREQLGGEVVGVEFEREKGRYVYEFKVITPAGRLREVYVDAKTAEILKSEDD